MTESANMQGFLRGLAEVFGSEQDADCTMVFCRDVNTPAAPAASSGSSAWRRQGSGQLPLAPVEGAGPSKAVVFGPPLPAHRLVLRLASKRFAAQLERWTSARPRHALSPTTAGVCSRPELRVPLGSETEVAAARAAIRFAYTGEITAGSVTETLKVRRQGDYLEISGCVAACDLSLAAKVSDSAAALKLFACEALWPDPQAEPSFAAILTSGKRLLVVHFGYAPSALNTPSLLEQFLALPAVALEALLGSDDFGADNEASVLLLLAEWMGENHGQTTAEIRQRLCRTVRLVQLSRPYLSLVLPALAADHEKDPEKPAGWWCGASVTEAAYVANFASATGSERQRLLEASKGVPRIAEALKASPRAQSVPTADGPTFSWHTTKVELLWAVGRCKPGSPSNVYCTFDQLPPQDAIVTWGFEWCLFIQQVSGQPKAGLYLQCGLPIVMASPGSRLSKEVSLVSATVAPIAARLVVHRRLEAATHGDVQCSFGSGSFVQLGKGWGWSELLPLREQQPQSQNVDAGGSATAAADPLAPWADYLMDGKITGTLTLLRPAA